MSDTDVTALAVGWIGTGRMGRPMASRLATVLAEKGGVSRAAFLDFLNNSVMGSAFTRYKSPALVNLDYTPTFTPVLLRKDFDLGLAAAGSSTCRCRWPRWPR